MFLRVMIIILLGLSVFSGLFVLFGSDKWERFLGYSMVSAKINIIIVLWALQTNKSFYLDIALVFVVMSYIGVIVLVQYMAQIPYEKRVRTKKIRTGKKKGGDKS